MATLPRTEPFQWIPRKGSGYSLAATLVDEKFKEIWDLADQTLKQAQQAGWELRNLEFPQINFPVDIPVTPQLPNWQAPQRPTLDDYETDYNEPDTPQKVELDPVPPFNDPEAWDFWYSSGGDCTPMEMIQQYVDVICQMLQGYSGLPPQYFRGLRERAQDQVYRDQHIRENQISLEFSRRNVERPSGVEAKRIDALRNEEMRNLSGIFRDIELRALEEALTSLRLAAQLALNYLQIWQQTYAVQVQAETELGNRIVATNQQKVQQLQADVAVFDAQVRGEVARITSEVSVLGQDISLYGVDGQFANAIASNDQARVNAETAEAQIGANLQLQQNQADIQARARDITESVENRRFDAELWRTVSAALFQAIDVNAAISSGDSESFSYRQSEDYGYSESYSGSQAETP